MNERQFNLISELIVKKETTNLFEHPFDVLIHSVLNTVKYEDIVNDYINNKYPEYNNSILSNIEKRLSSYSKRKSEKIYDNLKQLIEEEKLQYHKSQRIRKILELLLNNLDNEYKVDFFKTYFYSNYLNDKKRAINYLNFYNEDISKELLEVYFESGNEIFLIPIIDEKNLELLSTNIDNIWYIDLPYFIKKKLIEIISKNKFDKLEFLQDGEYDLYLLASLIAKKITPEEALEKLIIIPENKRHFALLNISKEINFNLIESEINKYIN